MSLKGIILIFEGHLIYVPHIPQVFILELKKKKKYVKMGKNKIYSKGTPFGVLAKNMKYVPHFEGHLIFVPHVPHLRDS